MPDIGAVHARRRLMAWDGKSWLPWPPATSRLELAATDYVAARLANEAAEPCDWTARAAEVDRTWHELLEASGLAPETGDE